MMPSRDACIVSCFLVAFLQHITPPQYVRSGVSLWVGLNLEAELLPQAHLSKSGRDAVSGAVAMAATVTSLVLTCASWARRARIQRARCRGRARDQLHVMGQTANAHKASCMSIVYKAKFAITLVSLATPSFAKGLF